MVPCKDFDIWIPQTATCQILEAKLLQYAFAYMKSHIESMYCIETGRRRREMKTPEFYK